MGEHHEEGLSKWLIYFSAVPALCCVGFAGWYAYALAKKDKLTAEVAGPFLATALCYFVGVGIGMYFQAQENAEAQAALGHAQVGDHEPDHAHEVADAQKMNADQTAHNEPAVALGGVEAHTEASKNFQPGEPTDADVDQKGRAGLFFSIYYCMTGVHAVHILGGMLVFGLAVDSGHERSLQRAVLWPVDYVGLYWHLVDLIWIYLFPLLYLIK